jgi:hypothetical protein
MMRPFARLRVAVTDSHGGCRVIVVPDPEGRAHQVYLVPDGVEMETVLQRVLETIVRPAA